jgi:hypothetical protein
MRGCTRAKCFHQRDMPANSASVGGHGGNTHGVLLQAGQHLHTSHTPLSLLQQSSSFLGPWHAQASGQRDTCRSDDWAERLATAPRARAFLLALHACLARCGRSGRDLSLPLRCETSGRRRAVVLHLHAQRGGPTRARRCKCVAARTVAPSRAYDG